MTEEEKAAARAKEVEDAVKKADAARKDAAELEERRKAGDNMGEKLDMVLSHLTDTSKRMDAIEARLKRADGAPEAEMTEDDDDGLTGLSGRELVDAKNKQTAALADAQSRSDSVAQAFGQSAPRFMDGETVTEYRRRLLRPFQGYSEKFKSVDLTKVKDLATLGAIEATVYADALAASSNPFVPEGRLESRSVRDASGRQITSFYGEPRTWMKQFSGNTMVIKQFNKDHLPR